MMFYLQAINCSALKFAAFAVVEMIDLIEILYRERDSVHFDSWSILHRMAPPHHRVLFIEVRGRPFEAGGREFSAKDRRAINFARRDIVEEKPEFSVARYRTVNG